LSRGPKIEAGYKELDKPANPFRWTFLNLIGAHTALDRVPANDSLRSEGKFCGSA